MGHLLANQYRVESGLMAGNTVSIELKGGVAEISLRRPEKMNSFDASMRGEFLSALRSARENSVVRAILITGTGKGFCAGQDLGELIDAEKGGAPLAFDRLVEEYNEAVRLITGADQPVVCAVNGAAAGAGANIALACDFVIAADTASFMQAFVHVGLVPDSGGSFVLPRLVGLAKAKELCMLGAKIPAAEALRMGMIYKVSPAAELLQDARALTTHLSEMPTRGLALMKRALQASLGSDLHQQLELEKSFQLTASHTSDHKEGITAFVEKREPKFTGR